MATKAKKKAKKAPLLAPDPYKPNPWFVVRNSKVHGKGCFARRDIPKGTRISEYVGDRITCQQKVVDIYDKKGGALWFVVSETELKDQSGKPVAKAKGITVVRNPDAAKK